MPARPTARHKIRGFYFGLDKEVRFGVQRFVKIIDACEAEAGEQTDTANRERKFNSNPLPQSLPILTPYVADARALSARLSSGARALYLSSPWPLRWIDTQIAATIQDVVSEAVDSMCVPALIGLGVDHVSRFCAAKCTLTEERAPLCLYVVRSASHQSRRCCWTAHQLISP